MPWYDDDSAPQYLVADSHRKVAPWPRPHGPRIDCRFRQQYGQFLPAPRPSQFFFRLQFEPAGTGPIRNASVNLLAVSDILLSGSSGVNADGLELIFNVKLFKPPDLVPFFDEPGILYEVILKNPGFPDLWWTKASGPDSRMVPLPTPLLMNKPFQDLTQNSDKTNYVPATFPYVSVNWPAQIFEYWPLSECLVLEVAEEGFAEFNGVDAWIDFPADMPYSTQRFKVQFDIRPQEAGVQMVVTGLKRFGSFATMLVGLETVQWWNVVIALVPGLVVGVWQTVRIEYNWSILGPTYSVWIDDIFNGSTAAAHTISPWDELGRRGSTIEGKFDLKNFKEWGQAPDAPILRIDVPLIDDACAVIPVTQKGTTTAMDLPSCP